MQSSEWRSAIIVCENGDIKVKCYENYIHVHDAVLPSYEEADRYAECWLKEIEYVYV